LRTIVGLGRVSLIECCLNITRATWLSGLALLLIACFISTPALSAQTQALTKPIANEELLRVQTVPVEGGAELVTIEARIDQGGESSNSNEWVPLVSVLRDTLGDSQRSNDRLRYLWDLTYTRPTFWQRMFGAVPFLYTRVGSKHGTDKEPPALIDLSQADHDVWNKLCWGALQTILLDPYGAPVRAATRSYQRNVSDFRKSHVIRALALLTLYQQMSHERVFTDQELKDIQARLLLTDKTFGGLVDDVKLPGFYQKEATKVSDNRGHNWELLRQQAEANGLYFEPLQMPDGSATHALLWIAKSDLAKPPVPRFDGRFLSIANPWTDKRLQNWKGYSEARKFDSDHRPVTDDSAASTEVEMIPLALYGLDQPKIPALLVDFRDTTNPKRREMSRRVLNDVTRNVLDLSPFGDIPYFLGRSVFDFVTGRRGMDINQPSRLKIYAQLKLLLSLDQSLDPALRSEINDRLELVSLNPFENSLVAEHKLAKDQYRALLDYANRPRGLPARLERDRREEMAQFEHDAKARALFRIVNVVSLGTYTHREKDSDDFIARLDLARQRAFHTRFLREVAQTGLSASNSKDTKSAPPIEVVWDLEEIKTALRFMAEHGTNSDTKVVAAAARIFARTKDYETRLACLAALSQINNTRARAELLRISERTDLDQSWRDLSNQYLSGGVHAGETTTANASIGTRSP